MRVARDSLSALTEVTVFRPEIVLLNVDLPGMDGIEVAESIRQRSYEKPIILIAISGEGQKPDQSLCRPARFDHHLTKPVDIGVLLSLIVAMPRRAQDAIASLPALSSA